MLHELNPQQRQAATTLEGPVLILAGAGSGKTKTLVQRMAFMIDQGIDPKSILGVSFTNKAAQEMRERVRKVTKKARLMTLGTFHSFGMQILKKEIKRLGYHPRFSLYDSNDQMALVREALKNYRGEKKFDGKLILSRLSLLKNKGVTPEEFEIQAQDPLEEALAHVYRYYQERLTFFNAIDFDDILLYSVKILKNFPEVSEAYSDHYRYIMVDEYQDTNPIQFELIRQLTRTHQNLCVVGDDDQSIYGFRGAQVSHILDFKKHYPKAQVISLQQNYRSTQPILNLANKVIERSLKRHPKKLWSNLASAKKPELWLTGDPVHESQVIIDDINKKMKDGYRPADFAILYRSNTQAPLFEEELRTSQVPYQMLGGQKYFDKKEIKDLIAYLNLIQNPNDGLSLRRIVNVPHRGLGLTTLKKFVEISENEKMTLFKAFKNFSHLATRPEKIEVFVSLIEKLRSSFQQSLSQGIKELIDDISFEDYVRKSHDHPVKQKLRLNDLQFFLDSIKRFEDKEEKPTLGAFLERLNLRDNQDQHNKDDQAENDTVTLLTLHSSKGLEFKCVYLVGVEEGLLPHKRVIDEGSDISEELRLFYVGLTRAQETLILSRPKERELYGKKAPCQSSRFLWELEDLYEVKDKTTFEDMTQEETQTYKKNFFADLGASLGEL